MMNKNVYVVKLYKKVIGYNVVMKINVEDLDGIIYNVLR